VLLLLLQLKELAATATVGAAAAVLAAAVALLSDAVVTAAVAAALEATAAAALEPVAMSAGPGPPVPLARFFLLRLSTQAILL
jgi:hypothetical protein